MAVVEDESIYTATLVRHLEDVLGGLPPGGAVVGVPNRHLILAHPIRDLSVIDAITTLVRLIGKASDEGPGSVSRRLYWWRGGSLLDLPYRVEGGRMRFFPPGAFVEVLNELEPPTS